MKYKSLVIYGAIGYFSPFLSISGGLDSLPRSFEWPVGTAKNVLKTEHGYYVVPLRAKGCMQAGKEISYE